MRKRLKKKKRKKDVVRIVGQLTDKEPPLFEVKYMVQDEVIIQSTVKRPPTGDEVKEAIARYHAQTA